MQMHPFRLAAAGLIFSCLLLGQREDGYNSNERILRIRELAKKGPTVLPTLVQYLSDSNRDIRVEAVKAIVKVGGERSLDGLLEAARQNDSEIQIRATDGIVNVYVPGYVAKSGLTGSLTRGVRQVKSFFSSRNDQIVDADVAIRPDVAQALAGLIANGASTDARANAALAAGILRDTAAGDALVQSLHAKDSELIFESLISIQKIHDVAAGAQLSFLARDLDERIQVTALETIDALRITASAPDVRVALENARNLRIRRAALNALAAIGSPDDRPVFQKYASESDVELRASALYGLGRIREPEDFPLLQQAFDQGEIDWRIHLAAAFGMVNEGKVDTAEFSPLPFIVESLQTKARVDTATADLSELASHDDVIAALGKMLPDLNRDQKVAICSALGTSGNPKAIPVLTSAARDIDPNVSFAASKALRTAQTRKPS